MMGTTYNNGMPTSVRPAPDTGSRFGNFQSGASTSVISTMQSNPPGGYQPASVLSPIGASSNGQSATTYAQNRALSYTRQ